jgi:hypothetical protein
MCAKQRQGPLHEVTNGDNAVIAKQGSHQKHGAVHPNKRSGPDGLCLRFHVIWRELELVEAIGFL